MKASGNDAQWADYPGMCPFHPKTYIADIFAVASNAWMVRLESLSRIFTDFIAGIAYLGPL